MTEQATPKLDPPQQKIYDLLKPTLDYIGFEEVPPPDWCTPADGVWLRLAGKSMYSPGPTDPFVKADIGVHIGQSWGVRVWSVSEYDAPEQISPPFFIDQKHNKSNPLQDAQVVSAFAFALTKCLINETARRGLYSVHHFDSEERDTITEVKGFSARFNEILDRIEERLKKKREGRVVFWSDKYIRYVTNQDPGSTSGTY